MHAGILSSQIPDCLSLTWKFLGTNHLILYIHKCKSCSHSLLCKLPVTIRRHATNKCNRVTRYLTYSMILGIPPGKHTGLGRCTLLCRYMGWSQCPLASRRAGHRLRQSSLRSTDKLHEQHSLRYLQFMYYICRESAIKSVSTRTVNVTIQHLNNC